MLEYIAYYSCFKVSITYVFKVAYYFNSIIDSINDEIMHLIVFIAFSNNELM